LRRGAAERADNANSDHKVGTQDRLQRFQFALNAASFGDMKAQLDGTRSARRQIAAAKCTAALVANSPLACLRAPRKPVATIKLTHKNPLVAEATQFRDAGDLPFLYRPTITLLTVF